LPVITVILVLSITLTLFTTTFIIVILVKQLRARNKRNLQRKTILAGGMSAQAKINSIQQTNVQVDNQPEVLLDLSVTKPNGEIIHTVVKTVIPIVNIPAFQKGNIIEVKHMTIDNELKFEVVGAYVP
jgi:cell division protein FtsX